MITRDDKKEKVVLGRGRLVGSLALFLYSLRLVLGMTEG
jgi:hypothetical protein